MDTIEAIILGIVQGLTEFLPVSSSGHLQIAKALMGVEIEQNLLFDVILHAATVLSTIVVLWSEVARLLRGLFSRRFNEEQAYVLKLLLSMIPIGIVGFTLKDRLDALLESPAILLVVGCMLLVTAALLWFVEIGQMPAWALLIVLVREFAVSGLRMIASDKGRVIAAGWSGKVKTASTMVCICLMLFGIPHWLNLVCQGVILVTTVYSGVEYFAKNWDVFQENK
mgnify:CR=1 FL=1